MLLSFEFFPPKSETALEKLCLNAQKLAALKPNFFSVTFGAAGSAQTKTLDTIINLQQHISTPIAPHISCVNATENRIAQMLFEFENYNIDRLVVLRGDATSQPLSTKFLHACDLVKFIRQTTGNKFHINVAAYPESHPQAPNAKIDLQHFQEKVLAGANGAITQYFYNIDAYLRFIEHCQELEITIPIIPGIMPIYNILQLERFSDFCGAELPRWIRKELEAMADSKHDIEKFGIEIVAKLCNKLLHAGAPGLHFYTLNRAQTVLQICEHLKL